jgi:protocatechuate 4,5-dioxygenase beta chain
MANLVGAFCTAHVPLIASRPGVADKKQVDHVMEAFGKIRARMVDLKIDTAIVVGDDHYTMFGPHCLPSMLIGIGDVDGPHEEWLGHERAPIANNPALAEHIMEYGFDHGFDWAVAKALSIDHSTFVPYLKIIKELDDVKMIPVYLAAGVAPLIRPKRCVQLGEMIASAVADYPGDERVAIIGTGGLSHWVGAADMGKVNEEFDHEMIDMIRRRDIDAMLALTDEYVLETAGNGAYEYRNWLVAMAAVKDYEMELLCYEPISPWVTGTTLVEFKFAA